MLNRGLHTRLVVLFAARDVRTALIRFFLAVCLGMILAGVKARAGVATLGNSPTGTVITVTYNVAPGTRYQARVGAANPALTVELQGMATSGATPYPGTGDPGLNYSGTWTVPVGVTWRVIGQRIHWSGPSVGQWVATFDFDTSVTGAAGTYAGPPKQITFSIGANLSPNAITYGVIRKSDGVLVAELDMAAGAAGTDFTVTGLPGDALGSQYQLAFWIPGAGMVAGGSGIWALTGTTPTVSGLPPSGAETVQNIDTTIDASQVVLEGTTPTTSQKVVVPAPTAVPNVVVRATGTGGAVWNIAPSGGGLSDTTFQEGVNKIVDGQVQQSGYLKKVADGWDGIGTAKAEGDAAVAGADAQAATAKTASDAAITGFPTTPSHSVTMSAPQWSYTMPASMGGKVVNMNPFTEDRFGPMASWLKQALFWWFGVLFAKHVIECAMPFGRGLAQAQQAKGNPVVAGTGAQATALVAAVAMSAIIVAGVGVMVAVMLQNFGLGSITSVWATNPYAGLPGGIAYVIDQVFPLSAWLILILGRPLVWPVFFKIYLGVATLVRFVVP